MEHKTPSKILVFWTSRSAGKFITEPDTSIKDHLFCGWTFVDRTFCVNFCINIKKKNNGIQVENIMCIHYQNHSLILQQQCNNQIPEMSIEKKMYVAMSLSMKATKASLHFSSHIF